MAFHHRISAALDMKTNFFRKIVKKNYHRDRVKQKIPWIIVPQVFIHHIQNFVQFCLGYSVVAFLFDSQLLWFLLNESQPELQRSVHFRIKQNNNDHSLHSNCECLSENKTPIESIKLNENKYRTAVLKSKLISMLFLLHFNSTIYLTK